MPSGGGVDAEDFPVSRDYEPQAGQWYEDLDNEESFQVLSVDPDEEIIPHPVAGPRDPGNRPRPMERDGPRACRSPEGWVDDVEEDEEEDDDEDWEDDEDEEDDDWDDDDEDDLDEDDDEYRDRE
jgi:hypothetical protein